MTPITSWSPFSKPVKLVLGLSQSIGEKTEAQGGHITQRWHGETRIPTPGIRKQGPAFNHHAVRFPQGSLLEDKTWTHISSFPIWLLGTYKTLLIIFCHSSSLGETQGKDKKDFHQNICSASSWLGAWVHVHTLRGPGCVHRPGPSSVQMNVNEPHQRGSDPSEILRQNSTG